MRNLLLCLFLLGCFTAKAQDNVSGLNARDFDTYWKVESESPDYKVNFINGDTTEIVAPKGLTLWRQEKMAGRVTIEYDACVMKETDADRLSDLNCFWMASDPQAPEDIMQRADWRGGVFVNSYSLQLYYLGYGGNGNTTTRFRRYDGNEAGIADEAARPAILKEYTDEAHLLQANHWYHVKITSENHHISYYIDGERLVDFRDAAPYTEGWFGFRTTESRTRIANFNYTCRPWSVSEVPLHWIGDTPDLSQTISFGVPFDEGQVYPQDALQLVSAGGEEVPIETWTLASWPDGSVKWSAVAGVVPGKSDSFTLHKAAAGVTAAAPAQTINVTESDEAITVETGVLTAYIPRSGAYLIDKLLYNGVNVGEHARLVCSTQSQPMNEDVSELTFASYTGEVTKATVERAGNIRALVKIEGVHKGADGREWLPFVVRLYFYAGSERVEMVHSFIFDGDQDKDFINSLGVRMDVPFREALYNRHVAFSCDDGGVWSEPVKPLVGRRVLNLNGDNTLQQQQMQGVRIPDYEEFDAKNRSLIDNWAAWDGYRLSQLNADGFSIRKRANANNPWIGTFSGNRAGGYAFVGDVSGGMGVALRNFWQSYPSSFEVSGAKSDAATVTIWLWSPDAEPMDLRHYDNVAHDLEASYEDVQEGMSTPYGIAHTTSLTLVPQGGYAGKADFAAKARQVAETARLMPEPAYLHDCEAFGVWSLPDRTTPFRSVVEDRLDAYISLYQNAIEQNKWYGFWNFGDIMHTYDPVRHEWRYDVGGYAWDNTELASNMWLWYNFLRSGRADIWKMAEAMTRHTTETDVYHIGPNAMLGSRHNVSHWGCGAKEGRISQAAWNRFYYYLTTDERSGDLMHEVTDADQMLYTLDPMRLAEPRDLYPCTAPARLRFGPDWLSYAGNWMTEWERTGNTAYRDKIITGMKSIVGLPSRLFTGPLALGYDPATGIITTECDPTLQTTNHLMVIMGGFEVMNEMMRMINLPEWNDAWLDLALNYKHKSLELNHNRFRISRLEGYAAYHLRDKSLALDAWNDLMNRLETTVAPPFVINTILPPEVPAPIIEYPDITTNNTAIWSLDAIYLQEVFPLDDGEEVPVK
ncbi:MAG: DUF6250 domain-containing protein [Prevotellaceae bacterium]|nr:DUF6250 domain-containing protein [Prevotellaceae bacterium]